jgi:hypothetical protein
LVGEENEEEEVCGEERGSEMEEPPRTRSSELVQS